MTFINEQAVYAQFFKSYDIIFAALVIELFELEFDILLALFELLNGELFTSVLFQLTDSINDLVSFPHQKGDLSFDAHGDFFKLRMPDDDGIIVAGGNSPTEAFAVFRLKIFLRGD